ncbi:hypothetical protein TRIUR3_18510 [Triticum urartu]|uniref:Uncharacterized protein n=2 Tax=Triticum TaxID=4564 RepID=M7Z755_TRIUA|nr:uncharacterized protein LOC119272093 [Triticum dicoccoides]XP_048568174.1 uncharacterized protein LOC125548654 [Triticum urartu]XP_048568181.1 uncharacterized protein LOC125548662 [Triticum urartu]EMS59008.1 hypothetical protein TRIUR3_18510 [Triticum urartu]VAH64316.1 unnamed protein product [Triticum turgidum subsp. durum]
MDAGKTPHPLPLSVAQKQIRDDVPLVCAWALVNAFAIAGGQASLYIAGYTHLQCIQSSSILPCLWIGMLCCAATQSAAAALALLLPCHRRRARRALAYLALAVTFLFHGMYAIHFRISLAAYPGGYVFGWIFYTVVICYMVVRDLTCLSDLLRGDGWGKQ